MPMAFDKTLRAAELEGRSWGAVLFLATVVILVPWLSWSVVASVPIYVRATDARIVSQRTVHDVQAGVEGTLMVVGVEVGDLVELGDVLFELDDTRRRFRLKAQAAELEALVAERELMLRELQQRRAALTLSGHAGHVEEKLAIEKHRSAQWRHSRNEKRRQRVVDLHRQGFSSQDELDDIEQANESLASNESTAKHSIDLVNLNRAWTAADRRVEILALERHCEQLGGRIEEAAATVARLEFELEQTKIRAPISGRVGHVESLRPSAVVQAADVLARVVPPGPLRIEASLARDAVGRVVDGDAARMELDGFPWTQYGSIEARVVSVGLERVDGTVQADLEIVGSEGYRGPLEHGLPGTLDVEVERLSPMALLIRSIGKTSSTPPRATSKGAH